MTTVRALAFAFFLATTAADAHAATPAATQPAAAAATPAPTFPQQRTVDRWQHCENGEWSPAKPEGGSYREMGSNATPPEGAATRQRPAGPASRPQPTTGTYPSASRDARSASQLDRHYAARQRGNQQFQQRSGGMSRGMGRRR